MFYAMNMVQTLDLEPVHFGPNMRQMIRKRLVERVRQAQDARSSARRHAARRRPLAH